MFKTLLIAILSFLYANTSLSQDLFEISYGDRSDIEEKVDDATLLKLNGDVFQQIFSEKPYRVTLSIPIENGVRANLILERFNVLTPEAKGIMKTNDGDKEFDLNNLIVAYKGVVDGVGGSWVSLNFSLNGINGVMLSPTERYVIGKSYNASGDSYLLYRESKVKIKSDFLCETSDEIPEEIKHLMSNLTGDIRGNDEIRIADIALELDFATHNRFGSVNNATSYALSLISTVSILYIREMNVKLNVPYVNVWTTPDPYTGSGSNQILTQFRSYWNNNNSGIQRTLAHLISTRSGGLGGIAYVNVLCSSPTSGSGYGFSNTNGGFSQLPAYSWDVDVVAHELGHNFGSPHTHSCNWPGGPIDTCYEVEGNCYNGPTHAIVGTIMSYCHLSAGKVLNFGPLPRELIRTRSENAGCMTNSPVPVVLAFPNGGETFRTFNTISIIWGSGFTGTVNLELSTNNGGNWSPIASNLPSSQNEYVWTIPNIDSTDQGLIRIYNTANPSQADTCDQVFAINKNLTMVGLALNSPPSFTRIHTGPSDTTNFLFNWRKAGYHESIRYKWSIQQIGTGNYYFYESDNSGVDTAFNVQGRFLDSIARADLGLTSDSTRCIWRVWAYNGYDSLGSNIFLVTIADQNVGINNISQEIPGEFKLYANYPNPFNPSTKIKFDVPEQSFINLKIYDYLGREIVQLVNDNMSSGTYEVDFNTSRLGNLPSGVYFYRIQINGKSGAFVDTKRMILVK